MVNIKYKKICDLLFPQIESAEIFMPNERTQLSGGIFITCEGNLHSGCDGGWARFRSPTTPRLEYLHGLQGRVFIEIVYIGALDIQLWAYPLSQSGRLVDEQAYRAHAIETVRVPLCLEQFSKGYFDINCRLLSESTVFSMVVVEEIEHAEFENSQLTTLTNYAFPKKHICSEEPLYYRIVAGCCYYSHIDECIHVSPGGCVEFSTYFNAFSCGKWAKNTVIEDLFCKANIQGKCIIEVWHALSESEQHKVYAGVHQRVEPGDVCLCMGNINLFDAGILYVKIHALSETRVYGGGYATSTARVDDVRLGIVITTYRREVEVEKAVAALVAGLPAVLKGPSVEIVVVDNGQTLQAEDVHGATLIPNRNLGGSGGFMRGLIHLEDKKHFTHCLFMDDDAFCEPESVARAYALLSFRREDNLAVAGAMLLQENMHIQHENGAYFDYVNHPIGCGLDLNVFEKVVHNEHEPAYQGVYGAWWFFAFPIAHVKHYAFPFFVRGDDILFSLSNKFSIMTLNGICSWQEDFANKHKCTTIYLGIRSVLLINSYVNSGFTARLYVYFNIVKQVLSSLLSYNYCEAQSIMLAMNDFMRGPSMWVRNIDMREKIKNLKQLDDRVNYFCAYENNIHKNFSHAHSFRNAGMLQLLIVIFTLNGHLLPSTVLDKSKYFLYSGEKYWLSAIWRKKSILIFNVSNSHGFILERSVKRFFVGACSLMLCVAYFVVRSSSVYRKYRNELGGMMTKTFWINQFKGF